ncbi:MAG: hypothetical protein HFH31_02335 [Bacilli bacterium]|nr:hypothetical protein [Bacilli bacterium]
MLEEFYERINLKSKLSDLSKIICEKYNLGQYISEELIILQISYLNSLGEASKEDKFWLHESEKGLSFSTPDFWKNIL